MAMRYAWDPKKNAANIRKHGITFESAVRIFGDFTYEEHDERFNYEEIREAAIGIVNQFELYVVFTDVSEEERRIISARPANKHERQVYWEARRWYERG